MLSEATNKKRRLIIGLLVVSLLVGVFLTQRRVFAIGANDLKQLDYSTSVTNGTGSFYQWGGQSLGTGITGSFQKLALYLSNAVMYNGIFKVRICEGNSISAFYGYGSGNNVCPTDLTGWQQIDQIEAREAGIVVFDFGNPFNFNANKFYLIDIEKEGGEGNLVTIYGASSDTAFVNGGGTYDSTFGTFGYLDNYPQFFRTYTDPVKDLYFNFAPAENTIEFVFPVNATSTADFESWHLNFSVAGIPPVEGKVKVNYGRDPNNYWNEYHDEINFIAYDNEIGEVAIMKGNLLSAGSWFAQGELIIGTSTVKITSPDIAFSVLGGGGYFENFYYGVPTTTWATSTLPIQITCDPEDSFFQYSLCKLAVWLFVPDSSQFNKFITLTDGIKNKPPIGYFYAVKSALEGLQSTSTKAFELNATSTGALASPIFNPLKTGTGFTLWLTFGFWLFGRIRHFEL